MKSLGLRVLIGLGAWVLLSSSAAAADPADRRVEERTVLPIDEVGVVERPRPRLDDAIEAEAIDERRELRKRMRRRWREAKPQERDEMREQREQWRHELREGLSDEERQQLRRRMREREVRRAEIRDLPAAERRALREQMQVDRERTTINEAEYSALKEEVVALRKERKERELTDALESAKIEATADKRFGGLVAGQLASLIEGGLISQAEDVSTHATRLFGLLEAVTEPVVQPLEQPAADAEAPVAEPASQEVTEEAVDIDNNIYKSLRDLMAHDRRTYGG